MFKFPPFLTEQWASAYFQILFSTLVFAIGIPALGVQLVMQEDVRHVVTHRQWKRLIWFVLLLLLFFSAISFIWILHPVQVERRAAEERARLTNAVAQPSADAATQEQSPQEQAPVTEAEAEEHHWERFIAGVIVTIIPVAALVFGYSLPRDYTREKVIKQFKSDLISGFNKTRTLNHDTLMKLVYLGEHGNPGIQKNLVLTAFIEIAEHVQKSKGGYLYKGRELAELVRAVRTVVEDGAKCGNDDNFKRAAHLLKAIWSRVSGEISNQDATLAASALKQLGLTAVTQRSEETATIYVMHAAECDDSVVFELGVAALNAKRYRVATIALDKLETLAWKENNGRELRNTETVHNLLGLLAQYDSGGPSASRRAAQFLSRARNLFSPSLEACVESATSYHYRAGSFDTADKVIKLSETLTAKATGSGGGGR